MRIREVSQSKFALGSDVTIGVVTALPTVEINDLFSEMWKQIYLFEKRFSRFLPMSELSVFNRSAGIKNVVSPEFLELLKTAKDLSIRTSGIFNPFILPALQRSGYIKSAAAGYENDSYEDYTHRKVVGIEKLNIGDDWASIPYGTALDLGGCGKGYLADQLGASLLEKPIKGYWISLGGDVATMGVDENDANITVSIQNAANLSGLTGWLVNCPTEQSAVATSGTFKRKEQSEGKEWHHIIDPLTLSPAITDIRLATVSAKTATEADVLASCAVILGSKRATKFLKKLGANSALLQCMDEKQNPFEEVFGNIITKTPNYTFEKGLRNA